MTRITPFSGRCALPPRLVGSCAQATHTVPGAAGVPWAAGRGTVGVGSSGRHTGTVAATVLQLSDTHLTAEPGALVHGADPDARLAEALAAWRATAAAPDLVLVTGDGSDDASPQACQRLAAALRPLGAPVLAVPGNHDRPEAVAGAFGAQHVAEVGGWRIVGFDTSLPGAVHGALDVPGALATLDALDRRPTVVALHHPPISPSTHPAFRLDGSDALLAGLAERPQVRAVVAGHLHAPFELHAPGGLAVLGCPSTLTAFTHRGAEMEVAADGPRGVRSLELGPDGELASRLVVV